MTWTMSIRRAICPTHGQQMVRHACANSSCTWLVCGARDCKMTLDDNDPDAQGPKVRSIQ